MDYTKAVDKLITKQLRGWDVAERNYAALDQCSSRTLLLSGTTIRLQYNPERRRSSAADVSKAFQARRDCFLCTENQPTRQRAILWGNHYKIQVNPYPIFKRHLTIADLRHVPQRLAGRVGDMLQLARDLPDFVVFYNGAQCGASAPGHAHFQAGCKGELPLCDEVLHATTHLLHDSDEGLIGYVEELGRSLFTIETSTVRAAQRYALRLLDLLPVPEGAEEPMVNVLCWWSRGDSMWHVVVFPRAKHRPACYGEGEGRLLLSPASTEMGGLWAVPVEDDYNALTPALIRSLYSELCMSRQELNAVLSGYNQRWEDITPV